MLISQSSDDGPVNIINNKVISKIKTSDLMGQSQQTQPSVLQSTTLSSILFRVKSSSSQSQQKPPN